MKKDVHPEWFNDAQVKCVCGNAFTVGSTKAEMKVDICAKCHPFFTGEMKYVDTLGRVEKFKKKQQHAQDQAQVVATKKKKKAEKQQQLREQKSLKEMLSTMR